MGGEFVTVKHEADDGRIQVVGAPAFRADVRGPFIPVNSTIQSFTIDSNLYGPNPGSGLMILPNYPLDLTPAGATAISRCAPTSPHADMATMIGELKSDGIPSLTSATLKGRDRGTFKGVASDNLKAQFELLPLVSDIKSVRGAIRDRSTILQQYARDSGRSVHRRYSFPKTSQTVRTVLSASAPWPPLSDVWTSNGTVTRYVQTDVETWFSGSFVYHRAGNDTQWSAIQQKYQDLNHLLGVGIGPGTVWNLLPWSWAVDWFSNVGDVMKNVQMMMNDGLIMEYGFIMRTETVTTSYARDGHVMRSGYGCVSPPFLPKPWVATVTRTTKWRNQANPFGFGITYGGLNFRQMSILASLGITRSSRVP